MPLLKIDFISSVLALADPVPFTVAILMVKSLLPGAAALEWIIRVSTDLQAIFGSAARSARASSCACGQSTQGFLHIPRGGGTALGAQTTVNTQVFVLHHDATGLRQRGGDQQRLRQILRRRLQTRAQVGFLTIVRHGQAIHGDRCRCRHRTRYISFAVNTVCMSQLRQRCTSWAACSAVNPSSTSILIFLESFFEGDVRHKPALHRRVVIGVRPLVHTHLAALQVDTPG